MSLSVASGPTTAIVFAALSSGRRPPSFFSRTIDFRATSRAWAAWAGLASACFSRAASQYRYGSSKRPSAYLTRRTRRTASSTSFTSTLSAFTRATRWPTYARDSMSMSLPAVMACCAACSRFSEKPCGIISPMDPQSETTKPWKPHSPFRMSRCRCALAVEGMPAISLNEFMNVATPASAAALNGGRTTFRRVCSEMSTVL